MGRASPAFALISKNPILGSGLRARALARFISRLKRTKSYSKVHFRPNRVRETDRLGLRRRVLLHDPELVAVRVPRLVQGRAGMRLSLLQLRGQQRRRPEAGDRLSAAEFHPGQQPFGQARQGPQPVLHGQAQHQIR